MRKNSETVIFEVGEPNVLSRRLLSIDNRRSPRFGGIVHRPEEVVTADQLWDRLLRRVEIFSSFLQRWNEHTRIPGLAAAFNGGARSEYYFENYYRPPLPTFNLRDSFLNLSSHLDPVLLERLKSLDVFNVPAPEPFADTEDNFHDRSRFKYVNGNAIDDVWAEAQKGAEPSLLDEDPLGDFGEWMEFTPPDVRYLLIGDTNHQSGNINAWINRGEYLSHLQAQGFRDLVIEWPESVDAALQRFFDGGISDEASLAAEIKRLYPKCSRQDRIELAFLAVQAKAHGVRLHAFDAQLGKDIDEKSPRILFERMSHDKMIATKMKHRLGDRKAAIIYGADHFRLPLSLIEQLGSDNCRSVDVHKDLKAFRDYGRALRKNSPYVAPYAFLIEEKTVVATSGRYLRDANPNFDVSLSSVMMGLQEREIMEFKRRLADQDHPYANLARNYGITADVICADVYWHMRAQACGFYTAPRVEPA